MAPTQYYGTGRRKTAVARVFIRPGSGKITVNHRDFENYFIRESAQLIIRQALALVESTSDFDVYVNVCGGGKSGQAGAVRLGLSRALVAFNPNYRAALKPAGLLTRDARKVERKKYGRPGARKRFQFSKR
ncbi:MAG: 30S ribosomal protein S9 [Deltaproteobacteria bacterium]|jgi:small subunit ribosomal protein S9|nr:30S ribosomal protein S9 [Deltaproteobacteria bacterium]